MAQLCNLVVELDERFGASGDVPALPAEIRCREETPCDERVCAWIDEEFGGYWSGEAHRGSAIVAYRNDEPVGFAAFDPTGLRFRWLRGVAREPGIGIFGPFGVARQERGAGIGRSLLRRALRALRARGYVRALIPAVGDPDTIAYYERAAGASVVERFNTAVLASPRPRVVVMASGNGSNLQAVLDGVREGRLPIDVVGAVVNDEAAFAIERARAAGVEVAVLPWRRKSEPRGNYDARLLKAVAGMRPDIVLLLGWMHLLDARFVRAFPMLLNLHPAFLPLDPARDDVVMPDGTRIAAFRGARAVRDALAAGSAWVGATVHAVTSDTDRGPVMARKPLRVEPGTSEAEVMAQLHPVEHRLVATAIVRALYERE